MNYTLLYSSTLLVSFTLTLIFLLYHSRYWSPATHFPLKVIYLLNMTSALMCVVWVLVDGKPKFIPVNYVANIIEFNCLGYCGYCWLRYCLNFVDIPALKTRLAKFLMLAPIAVVTLLIVTTPLTHWLFYIDSDGFFRRGSIYHLQQTGYLYLCFSTAICLLYRKMCTTSSERRHLTVLSMFPLSPAILGSVQIIAPSGVAPTIQVSILISLILVFVDELDQKITRDSLTQLVNRYEFERILQNKMRDIQEDGPRLYIIMSDLDDFKSINDNFGHQQGDAALQTVGRVLSEVSVRYGAVCSRISGDEFTCILEADSREGAEVFRKAIEDALSAASRGLPYTLQLSIGIAEYDGKAPMMDLLAQADQKMYEQKKLHKSAGRAAAVR